MHARRPWPVMGLVILLALLAAPAYAAEAPGALRSFVPQAERASSPSTAECPSRCMNGFSLVFERTAGGQCALKMSISCYPSTCAPAFGVCEARACQGDSSCAAGAGCNLASGQCAPLSYRCTDAFTVIASTGAKSSCEPYKCNAGACAATCNGPGDCAPGYQCNAGRCQK
jgi:hypothetical protein